MIVFINNDYPNYYLLVQDKNQNNQINPARQCEVFLTMIILINLIIV